MTHHHSGYHVDDDAVLFNPAVRRLVLAILVPLVLATIAGLILAAADRTASHSTGDDRPRRRRRARAHSPVIVGDLATL